jgi:hypothetical protein
MNTPLDIDASGRLVADYASRRGVRLAGVLIAIVGGLVGAGMVTHGANPGSTCTSGDLCTQKPVDPGIVGAGLAVFTASLVGGLYMAFVGDKLTLTLVPDTMGAAGHGSGLN